jgi:glycosyltransferase involved in cell wall biosynthesis
MMAMKLPIVCSDIQCFRDLSEQDGDMLFFEVSNPIALAQQIEKLYCNAELREHLAERAFCISQSYKYKNVLSQYNNYYNDEI